MAVWQVDLGDQSNNEITENKYHVVLMTTI